MNTRYWIQIQCKDETEALLTALDLRQRLPKLGDRLSMQASSIGNFDGEITITLGSDDSAPSAPR